tara:strand:+ start:14076 stop:14618 length:543 start_codon:yes stop_codon:yes gene_type:complete
MLVLSLYIGFLLQAGDIGLQNGNHIQLQPLSGEAHVWCDDGPYSEFRIMACYQNSVRPDTEDYFVAKGYDADRVELEATQESGKTVTKKMRFRTIEGRTKKKVNLLMNTLFQRALLAEGENQVDYRLTKDKELVKEGSFKVVVEELPELYCGTRSLSGFYQCHDIKGICDAYFFRNRSCH